MTHSSTVHLRRFVDLVEAVTYGFEVSTDARTICGKVWHSSDVPAYLEVFDSLDEDLERIDAVPKRRTFGAYARSVRKLMMAEGLWEASAA